MVWKRRKISLIRARFQLKVVGVFLGVALACMCLQYFLLSDAIRGARAAILVNPQAYDEVIRHLLWENLLIACCLLIPFSVSIGNIITYRIAGPISCFEQYFRELKQGPASGPCCIREQDEFQELCKLINEAIEARRIGPASSDSESAGQPSGAAAAARRP